MLTPSGKMVLRAPTGYPIRTSRVSHGLARVLMSSTLAMTQTEDPKSSPRRSERNSTPGGALLPRMCPDGGRVLSAGLRPAEETLAFPPRNGSAGLERFSILSSFDGRALPVQDLHHCVRRMTWRETLRGLSSPHRRLPPPTPRRRQTPDPGPRRAG